MFIGGVIDVWIKNKSFSIVDHRYFSRLVLHQPSAMTDKNFARHLLCELGLSLDRVTRMLPRVKMEHAKQGDVLICQGAFPVHWIYVLSGFIGANVVAADGDSVPVDILGSGCWLGESMVLHQRSSPLEFVCLSNASVLTLPIEDVRDAFEHDARFARSLARLLASRGAVQAELIALIKAGSPQMRVVMGLTLLISSLNGGGSSRPSKESPDATFHIPLKQSLLASLCGVSRGVFSTQVQKLVAAGWVKVSYGTLDLLSVPSWLELLQACREQRSNLNHLSMPDLLALVRPGTNIR